MGYSSLSTNWRNGVVEVFVGDEGVSGIRISSSRVSSVTSRNLLSCGGDGEGVGRLADPCKIPKTNGESDGSDVGFVDAGGAPRRDTCEA